MAKEPEPRKAPTGPKPPKPEPAPEAHTTRVPVADTPEEQRRPEPVHPVLEAMSEDDRALVRELAIQLTYLEHRNPFGYSLGTPIWHNNIRWARLFITGFRFMEKRR